MMLHSVERGSQTNATGWIQHLKSRSLVYKIYPQSLENKRAPYLFAQKRAHDRSTVKRCLAVIALLELLEEEDNRVLKRGKARHWIKRREEKGYFTDIVREFMTKDTTAYREMMRMNREDFKKILKAIEPDITPHQAMRGHKVIAAAERFTLTIWFLATGETYRSLNFQFCISRAAIAYIVDEVCKAIVKILGQFAFKSLHHTKSGWQLPQSLRSDWITQTVWEQ